MKICGTCRHKGDVIRTPGDDQLPTTFFLCDRIKHGNHPFSNGNEKGEHARVMDGSGYFAALCVEDDFGCNLWELKP